VTLPDRTDQIVVLNSYGKEVLRHQGHNLTFLDVRALPDGLYTLHLTQKGKMASHRLQIKH
jgi:hypothetical protein